MSFSTVFIIACLALAAFLYNREQSIKHDLTKSLRSAPDFRPSQEFIGVDGRTALGIDESRKALCFVTRGSEYTGRRVVSYADLISSEILENGRTVTRVDRGSQIGGAVVGGLLLGGVGAVVGGLSGSSVSTTQVSRITLRITVADTGKPMHEVCFLNRLRSKPGFGYDPAIKNASHWHALVAAAIREAQSAQSEEPREVVQSMVGELKELASLRNSGVLTEDEFQEQKRKLLSRQPPHSVS